MWGIPFDEDEIFEKLNEKYHDYNIFEALKKISKITGLEYNYNYEEGNVYIGISPFSIEDYQTGAEFKHSICDKFKLIGMDIKPNHLQIIEDIIYN